MNLSTHIDAKLLKLATTLLSILFVTACSDTSDDEWSPYKSKATLDYASAGYDETTIKGTTSGDTKFTWTAVISQGSEWASFVQGSKQIATSGKVGTKFTVYLDINDTTSPRSGEISIKFSDGYTAALKFLQYAKSENPTYDRAWAEQPEYKASSNYIYKTYYTTLYSSTKQVRSYSICYDTKNLVSHWVAYPIHSVYLSPAVTRTNAWAFDNTPNPTIPESLQQDIVNSAYGSGHARGHMLPSASRYSTIPTNEQTFYATNMMPQAYNFNSGSWADLETDIRNTRCNDTLYVVVGTLYENSQTITSKGRTIKVPSHCFKLLLRTKKGNTGKSISQITSADELISIGFLYRNDNSSASIKPTEAAMSVSDLEQRSGFTFFRNIDKSIADEVKRQCNLNDWPYIQ